MRLTRGIIAGCLALLVVGCDGFSDELRFDADGVLAAEVLKGGGDCDGCPEAVTVELGVSEFTLVAHAVSNAEGWSRNRMTLPSPHYFVTLRSGTAGNLVVLVFKDRPSMYVSTPDGYLRGTFRRSDHSAIVRLFEQAQFGG